MDVKSSSNVYWTSKLPTVTLQKIGTYLTPSEFVKLALTSKVMHKQLTSSSYQLLKHQHKFQESKFLELVLGQRRNVLLHGPAGTGKSHLLKSLHHWCTKLGIPFAMTSTTAISASMIPNGTTIHSFSGLGAAQQSLDKLKEFYSKPLQYFRAKQWNQIDMLVVDEVSMLSASLLEKLDWFAKANRSCLSKPFGGLQVIFCGDFMQLTPVMGRFAFFSPVWFDLDLVPCTLTLSIRHQNDPRFAALLYRMRIGQLLPNDEELLKNRTMNEIPERFLNPTGQVDPLPPVLFPKKKDALQWNLARLQAISAPLLTVHARDEFFIKSTVSTDGKSRVIYTAYHGPAVAIPSSVQDQLNHRQPAVLEVKHECQLLVTKNFGEHHVANGMVGLLNIPDGDWNTAELVIMSRAGRSKRSVRLDDLMTDQTVLVNRQQNLYVRRRQYAVRLGYAVTIHSSQGMTFDEMVMNVGKDLFAAAQGYVGVSRITQLRNLRLLGLDLKKFKANPNALHYMYLCGLETPPPNWKPSPCAFFDFYSDWMESKRPLPACLTENTRIRYGPQGPLPEHRYNPLKRSNPNHENDNQHVQLKRVRITPCIDHDDEDIV